MDKEIIEARASADNASALPRKEDKQTSLEVIRLRKWPIAVAGAVLTVLAGGGIAGILWFASVFVAHSALWVSFVVGSTLNLFLLVAVLAQAFIYWAQRNLMQKQFGAMYEALVEARRQTEIAGTSFTINSQAYVCVHSISLDLDKDRIFIEIENLGRVPADSIEVELWEKLEIPPKFRRKNAAFQCRQGWGEKTSLFPGNLHIAMRLPLDMWLGREDIALIKSGDANLIVEGLITFYDGFLPREPKNTHFAFEYRLTEKKWFPLRILSPEEVEAKSAKEAERKKPN